MLKPPVWGDLAQPAKPQATGRLASSLVNWVRCRLHVRHRTLLVKRVGLLKPPMAMALKALNLVRKQRMLLRNLRNVLNNAPKPPNRRGMATGRQALRQGCAGKVLVRGRCKTRLLVQIWLLRWRSRLVPKANVLA